MEGVAVYDGRAVDGGDSSRLATDCHRFDDLRDLICAATGGSQGLQQGVCDFLLGVLPACADLQQRRASQQPL